MVLKFTNQVHVVVITFTTYVSAVLEQLRTQGT